MAYQKVVEMGSCDIHKPGHFPLLYTRRKA